MQLVKYEAARIAINEAHSVDEVIFIKDKHEVMRAYAKLSGDYEMANLCAEMRIRAERRLGEMLIEQKESGQMNKGQLMEGDKTPPSHGGSAGEIPKLSDMGISHNMSSRAQTIAKVPDNEFESIISEYKEQEKELTSTAIRQLTKKNHVMHNSGENEWYTPSCFIESARLVMGSIDTDPASCELANKTVKAHRHWTLETNGLTKIWTGNIWLNPPYAQPSINLFIGKLLDPLNNISQYCVLVNNGTDTKWFQKLLIHSACVCFVKGRIKFIDKEGNQNGTPLQGQAVFYFGENAEAFVKEFNQYGEVL